MTFIVTEECLMVGCPKCKVCVGEYNRNYYQNNAEKFVEYRKSWFSKPSYKEKSIGYMRRMREKYPEKYRCRTAVFTALQNGSLQKQLCEVCGLKAQCRKHHVEHHQKEKIDGCAVSIG